MEDNKSMFYIVSIIGIVAIVGMVVLIVNSTHSNGVVYARTPTVSTATDSGDSAGQAIRIAARANARAIAVTPGNGLQNNVGVKDNGGSAGYYIVGRYKCEEMTIRDMSGKGAPDKSVTHCTVNC